MSATPMPMEWHPAYADKPQLMDWLERRGEYANHHEIVLPIVPRLYASFDAPPEPLGPSIGRMILRRSKAAAPAPFVGDPLWQQAAYVWSVGVDDVGRCIAGEAHLIIEPDVLNSAPPSPR